MRALLARVVILLVALGVVLAFGQKPAGAATVNVVADNFYFCSPSFQGGVCDTVISVGDTVTWNFASGTGTTHTTTECGSDCNTPTGSPLWNEARSPGGSYSRQFNQVGVFLYLCAPHPTLMRGRIIVTQAVGGVAKLPNVEGGTRLKRPVATGSPEGLAASVVATVVALAGAAWYVRRRLLT